eukprot:1178225-Prorocentrum_minimum.AAC.1
MLTNRSASIRQLDQLVFVLGAVRDVTTKEEEAVTAAAASLGIPVVGCNLGRTAEFTSKVVHALNHHHLSGRLAPAVGALLAQAGAGVQLDKLEPLAVARSQAGAAGRKKSDGKINGLNLDIKQLNGKNNRFNLEIDRMNGEIKQRRMRRRHLSPSEDVDLTCEEERRSSAAQVACGAVGGGVKRHAGRGPGARISKCTITRV